MLAAVAVFGAVVFILVPATLVHGVFALDDDFVARVEGFLAEVAGFLHEGGADAHVGSG